MRFSVGCLMPTFLENPPTRPRPPRSVASAAAEPRPHIHALPRQGCPGEERGSSLLEERRPGAARGRAFWGSDTMLAQEGRALPKGPRPQRGRAGGEGEAGDPPTLGLCRGSALGAPDPCPGTGRPGRAAGGGTGRDGGGGAPTAGRGHGEKPLGSARSGAGDRRLEPTQRTLQTARPRCPASAFSQPVG